MTTTTKTTVAKTATRKTTKAVPSESLPTIKVRKLHPDAVLPTKQRTGDIGYDLYCLQDISLIPKLKRGDTKAYLVRTGVAVEFPEGIWGSLHLRSGKGQNTHIRLANQTGILDNNYRGEIMLCLENTGNYVTTISKGERIGQLVIHREVPVVLEETKEGLEETERNAEGFGSSGK